MNTSRKVITGIVVFIALAAVLNLVGLAVDRFSGGEVVPGPDGSSYVTTGQGWAAYHDLLEEVGHPVQRLEGPVRPGTLDPATTLVIASPSAFSLDERQIDLIARFIDDGGRLVLASTSFFGDLATTLLDPPPVLGNIPGDTWTDVLPVPETRGVGTIAMSGLYAWDDTGAALPVVGSNGATAVAVASIGEGRLVLLADPGVLSNSMLDQADNAVLGTSIVGEAGRTVVFNEYVHGYGGTSAVGAIPSRWRSSLVLAAVAAMVWLWAIGSRFAPAEPEHRTFPPSRSLYVDALAASLARSPDGPTPALLEILSREGITPETDDPVEMASQVTARRR